RADRGRFRPAARAEPSSCAAHLPARRRQPAPRLRLSVQPVGDVHAEHRAAGGRQRRLRSRVHTLRRDLPRGAVAVGGGLPFHTSEVAGFDRRNTLGKLLDANRYQPIMTRDHVVGELLPPSADAIVLERGRKQMEMHACPAVGELESALAARDPGRPIFFWSLPQDVHISVLTNLTVPAGEAYPGFFDKFGFQLRRLDACVGRLVDILKRADLYDDSIIVLTADHGDLYGLEGRWGHANLLYPDVMRVPLIVHVPPRLRAGLSTNVGDVAFLTDLVPTLYRLLGYDPKDLGPLFGRSLSADAHAAVRSRRDDDFLVGSAYGAVYGVVGQNGRQMYVVDTIEGREYMADMRGAAPRSVETTPAVTAANRGLIRRDID